MNPIIDNALKQLEQRPEFRANPTAQEWARIIRENDETAGRKVAENILSSTNVTVSQAMEQARRMFGR